MLSAFIEAKKQCKDNQWAKGKECKDLVGFALEYKELPQQAIDFASGFYDDLDPKAGVSRNGENNQKINTNSKNSNFQNYFSSKNRVLNKVRDLLKNSLAIHSDLQEKGVENCLQTVTKDGFKL